jgi:hypothetical protein
MSVFTIDNLGGGVEVRLRSPADTSAAPPSCFPGGALSGVSEHFESNLERLKERSSRNNLARRCVITLCWDHAGLSHAEIAALFRMPSSNSVAQTIRRTKTQDAQTLKVLKHQISHK